MFGDRMKLEDYTKRYYFSNMVYKIDKPHKALKYNRPIEVWYERIDHDGTNSRFLVFDNDEFITNTFTLPCLIEVEDIEKIAKDLVDELLSMSDFEDLDRELAGKCACKSFENIYKSCDECPQYCCSKDDGGLRCLGAMYSIPSHVNFWSKTQEKWNKIYGEGSDNYKEYKIKLALRAIREATTALNSDRDRKKRFAKQVRERL